MKVSRSAQTRAFGAAIAAAVVAGVHKDFLSAQKAMTGLKSRVFNPDHKADAVDRELYAVYRTWTTPSAPRRGKAICMT